MNLAAWNVRGLNKKPHQDEVVNFINSNGLSLCGFLETKVKSHNSLSISKRIKKGWKWIFNNDYHYNGRIWVGWDPNFWDIVVVDCNAQWITCKCTFKEKNVSFLSSFVYAYNNACDRIPLWNYFLSASSTILPWIVLGDFNCIVDLLEVDGGREHWTPEMETFRECLLDSRLSTLSTVGHRFTWCNNRGDTRVYKRLDRALVNSSWLLTHPNSQCHVLNRGIMDHCPLKIHAPMEIDKVHKNFQFFNYMFQLDGFKDAVLTAWSQPLFGDPLAVLGRKLKLVKQNLVKLNKIHGDVREKTVNARATLAAIQDALLISPRDPVLLRDELQGGGRPFLKPSITKSFFFNQTKQNWNHNKILAIKDANGQTVLGHKLVASVAVDFFKNSLGSPPDSQPIVLDVDCGRISDQAHPILLAPVDDVLVFNTLKGANSTLIALIPKHTAADSMKDFRPISLCTMVYKCISKILASRLKKILPNLIDHAQSAFIPGRQISDNILLAQELFRGYSRDTGTPKCALKIDLHKAFDSIRWDFLFAALDHINFPPQFVGWVRECVTTAMYSVKFHWRCKELSLTHLLFADDVLLFSRGDSPSITHLMDSLVKFGDLSGLNASLLKSSSFFCNCPPDLISWFDNAYSMPRGQLPVKFLGVPLISSKLSVNDCVPLVDRITSKILSWTSLLLSYMGRLRLIEVVLHSVQNFWTRHFVLPKCIHKLIQQILTRFLWKGDITDVGGAKVSWAHLCLPKEEGGLGLKKSEEWNRAQILSHLWSVVNQSGSLWSKWVVNSVLKGRNIWVIPVPTDCSWIWRKVLGLRGLAKRFVKFQLGNGMNTSLWFDPWWRNESLALSFADPIIRAAGSSINASVYTLISFGEWRLPRGNLQHHHANLALAAWLRDFDYPSFDLEKGDMITWEGTKSSQVSTRLIWNFIRLRGDSCPWAVGVWFKLRITRFCFLSWLLCLDRVVTRSTLFDRHVIEDSGCIFCIGDVETAQHLFIACPYARFIHRSYLFEVHGLVFDHSLLWKDWIMSILAISDLPQRQVLLLYLQVFAYHMWRERNARLHGGGSFGPRKLLEGIMVDIRGRAASSTWLSRLICSRPMICTWLF
ncbi:uncharacterized protein LOC135147075 [Daucus carota subsp. sativus]|uniref:uncharacterized protein LOC135147075 n=1 Tax=Daucus carota subsp. sativus TaxID=79200 RepID=UPI0030839770